MDDNDDVDKDDEEVRFEWIEGEEDVGFNVDGNGIEG